MRGLQITEAKHVSLVELPKESIGDDMVRVQVRFVGLCGTDFALANGTLGLNVFPVVPGHEVAGIVSESTSPDFQPGDPVVLDPLISCGDCEACRIGRPQWCTQVGVIGVVRDGGAREELVLPAKQWVHWPKDVPLEVGAVLVEPIHVVHAVLEAAGARRPNRVLVIGTGALGLMVVQSLNYQWPGVEISVYDTVEQHVEHAEGFGAARLMDTDRGTFDLVIDGVGSTASLDLASMAVRQGGRLVVYGVPKAGVNIPNADVLFRKNIHVVLSRLYSHDFSRAVQWAAEGVITPHDVVSDWLSLPEAAAFLQEEHWKRPERWGKTLVRVVDNG